MRCRPCRKHDIVVPDEIAAYIGGNRKSKRTFHAVGDGTVIVDGRRLSPRKEDAIKAFCRHPGRFWSLETDNRRPYVRLRNILEVLMSL